MSAPRGGKRRRRTLDGRIVCPVRSSRTIGCALLALILAGFVVLVAVYG